MAGPATVFVTFALAVVLAPGTARAAAGDLDPAYGVGGVAVNGEIDPLSPSRTPANVSPVGLQPGGQVIVAGYVGDVTCSPSCLYESYYSVGRLNADGTADTTFGDNGRLRVDFGLGPDVHFEQALLQPDGSILILGQSQSASPSTFVLRLTPDGSLDSSFAGDGVAELDFPATSDIYGLGFALQADGRIVIGAATESYDYMHSVLELARLNGDGSQDLGYGDGGYHVDPPRKGDSFQALVVDSHDRTILIHSSHVEFHRPFLRFSRYLPDGSPDLSFGGDGEVEVRRIGIGVLHPVVTDSDSILVLDTIGPASLIQINAQGEHDPDFGERGVMDVRPRGLPQSRRRRIQFNGITLQPDGKIVVTGGRGFLGGSVLTVGRLMPDGSPDPEFAGDGFASVFTDPVFNQARPLELPGERLLVAGGGRDASFVSARFKTGRGPRADADADGVSDVDDHCPLRAGTTRGCPRFRRLALTLEIKSGRFLHGALETHQAQCAARARVRILRRVAGPDLPIGSFVLSRGDFREGEASFDTHVSARVSGPVYVTVHRSLDQRIGICTGVRSKAARAG